MDLAHLLPETRKLALLPAAERLALVPAHCWIGYTRAGRALARLEEMLAREPGRVRPRVVGPSNNGKTAIAERFECAHPQHGSADGEHEVIPVLLVQVPPSPTLNRLYAAILDGLGVSGPMAMHGGRAAPLLEGLALRLLRQVGCRMLMLDELHNLLAAPIQRQREVLNLLHYLGNELRIPLACLGTREAYLAIRSDDQLENCFEPFLLSS